MQKSDFYRIIGLNEGHTRWTRDRPGGHEMLTYFGYRDSNLNGGKHAKKIRKKADRYKGKKQIIEELYLYNTTPVVCSTCHDFCEDMVECANRAREEREVEIKEEEAQEEYFLEEERLYEESYYYEVLCDEDTAWDPHYI